MENLWFKNAGFGLMIHWGLYSVLGGEYKGKRMDEIGEWVMSKYEIPCKEYEKLAKVFNPIYFDAEEWVQLAKNAGMKYIVITAKQIGNAICKQMIHYLTGKDYKEKTKMDYEILVRKSTKSFRKEK